MTSASSLSLRQRLVDLGPGTYKCGGRYFEVTAGRKGQLDVYDIGSEPPASGRSTFAPPPDDSLLTCGASVAMGPILITRTPPRP